MGHWSTACISARGSVARGIAGAWDWDADRPNPQQRRQEREIVWARYFRGTGAEVDSSKAQDSREAAQTEFREETLYGSGAANHKHDEPRGIVVLGVSRAFAFA
jgi:hypothetical protein